MFLASSLRATMNALINGSGNAKVNFATALLDGIILRSGLALRIGLARDMKYTGFWLGDAPAGFTPFWRGILCYGTSAWKKARKNRAAPRQGTDAKHPSPIPRRSAVLFWKIQENGLTNRKMRGIIISA